MSDVASPADEHAGLDLSDELLARPAATQDVLERILSALERIEAKLDGVWREGPNSL